MILYRGVFLPKVSNGIRLWVHAIKSNTVISKLGTLQRRALLGITRAYRTTSTATLQVLAGVLPLDLELCWLAVKVEVKLLPNNRRAATMKNAYESLVDSWQTRWVESTKVRGTFECFPDIRKRLRLPIVINHELSQFLTGHGNFNAKITELGLEQSPLSACCNGPKTVGHVTFDCLFHEPHRQYLELAVNRAGYLWPCRRQTWCHQRVPMWL